jgi:hypothetical protein
MQDKRKNGGIDAVRTHGLQFRKLSLYPAELRPPY